MEIEGDGVIEADVDVVEDAVVEEAEVEGDDFAIQAPDEEADAVWHFATDAGEELGG